jgi:hypothetical protein
MKMKNLLYLLILVVFTSCGYNAVNFNEPVIITHIESRYDGNQKEKVCWYYTQDVTNFRLSAEGYFCAPCGEYTIGDTVKIVKY